MGENEQNADKAEGKAFWTAPDLDAPDFILQRSIPKSKGNLILTIGLDFM